jgi:phosphate transport system substrate-binding protein
MDRRSVLLALVAGAGAVVAGSAANFKGFRWQLPVKEARKSLLIGGAGAMVPLNEALASAFIKQHSLVDIVVDSGGSLQGLIAAKRGAIDLAAMTRDLTNEEDDESAHDFLIARGDVTIVVNKSMPVKSLSQQQVRGLLVGELTNWQQVGGPDAAVKVISRTKGSTTRQFVEEVVLDGGEVTTNAQEMETTKRVAASVAADPYAVGYVASKDSDGIADVAALAVDGVAASRATVLSGRYPYTHSFSLLLYGELDGLRFDFVRFARSAEGQKIVAQNGLVPVC